MASRKPPTPKGVQPQVKPTPSYGVVGARGGGYGKKATRNTLNSAGKRGSTLRGGQPGYKPIKYG
jgi:hypothetical protein